VTANGEIESPAGVVQHGGREAGAYREAYNKLAKMGAERLVP